MRRARRRMLASERSSARCSARSCGGAVARRESGQEKEAEHAQLHFAVGVRGARSTSLH